MGLHAHTGTAGNAPAAVSTVRQSLGILPLPLILARQTPHTT
jgi:hypothetical protein